MDSNNSDVLPIIEEFYSVQGEGKNAGRAAYFLRLAGCDVNCPWCDTKFSWNVANATLYDIEQIAERASKCIAKNVVVTGGEPLMYNLDGLCKKLKQKGLSIWLETSGSRPLSGCFDWICVSPKTNKPSLDSVLSVADELKIVVATEKDFSFAENYARKVKPNCVLLLQAEWSKSGEMASAIIDYVLQNPKWTISIQTQKIFGFR